VLSSLNKKLLIFLLDLLQEEKEFFDVSISHSSKKTKIIENFFSEARTKK